MSEKKGRIFVFTSKDTLDEYLKIEEILKKLNVSDKRISLIKIDSKVLFQIF
jgi:hypothetical protein